MTTEPDFDDDDDDDYCPCGGCADMDAAEEDRGATQ